MPCKLIVTGKTNGEEEKEEGAITLDFEFVNTPTYNFK